MAHVFLLAGPASHCGGGWREAADSSSASQDFLLTRMNLAGTLAPEEVLQHFQAFTRWVRRLGVLQLETEYGANDYRWDLRFQVGQAKTP